MSANTPSSLLIRKAKYFLLTLGCALILSSVLLGLFTGTQVNSDLVERIKLDQSTSAIELNSGAPKVISALAPQHDVPLQDVTEIITESAVADSVTDAEPLNLKVLDLHIPAEDTDTDRQNN